MAFTTPVATPYLQYEEDNDNGNLKDQTVCGVVIQEGVPQERSCSPFFGKMFFAFTLLAVCTIIATSTIAIFYALRTPEVPQAPLDILPIMQSNFEDTYFNRLKKLVIFGPQSQLVLTVNSFSRVEGGLCGSKVVLSTDRGDLEVDQKTLVLRNTGDFDYSGFALTKGPDFILLGTPKLEAHLAAGPVWQFSPCVSKVLEAPAEIPTLPTSFELDMVLHTPCSKETNGGMGSCYQLDGLPRPGFVIVDERGWIQEKQRVISDFPRFQRIESVYPHSPDQMVVDIVSCGKLSMSFQKDAISNDNFYCKFVDFENKLCKNATDLRSHSCETGQETHPICFMQPTATKFDGKVTVRGVSYYKLTSQDYSLGGGHPVAMHLLFNMKMELNLVQFEGIEQWASVTSFRPLSSNQIDTTLFSMPTCKSNPSVPKLEETVFPAEELMLGNATAGSAHAKFAAQEYRGIFPGTGCGAKTVIAKPVIPYLGTVLPYGLEIAYFPDGKPCSLKYASPVFPVTNLPCPSLSIGGDFYVEANAGYQNLYADGCVVVDIGCKFPIALWNIDLGKLRIQMCPSITTTTLHGTNVLMVALTGRDQRTFFRYVDVSVSSQLYFVPHYFNPATSQSAHLRLQFGVQAVSRLTFFKVSVSFPVNLPSSGWYYLA